MASLTDSINNAKTTADFELSSYFSQMSASDKADYAGENAMEALNRIKALKQDRFTYLNEDLRGADNNLTSTAYYITRTNDLKNMATDIDSVAAKQLAVSDINAGVTLRQNEINEWANDNKLDTLYFLQVLFISLTFISSLMFLNSKGLISSYLLNLCIVLVGAFAAFVLITRARYTNVRRNPRYWNKMRFTKEAGESSDDTCGPVADTGATTAAKAPKKVLQCNYVDASSDANSELNSAWGSS